MAPLAPVQTGLGRGLEKERVKLQYDQMCYSAFVLLIIGRVSVHIAVGEILKYNFP